LSDRQCRQLQVLLLQGATAHGYGTDLWTLERISALIRQHFGVRYHPGHVFKLLHRLGWSCQKPARRAKQRDEAAIAHWRRHTWPQIKKGP
jgi:transposase